MSVVVVWFVVIISAVVVVKKTEKPRTPMAQGVHDRKHHYN